MPESSSKKNTESLSDQNASLLEKYRVSFNSIAQINYVSDAFSDRITLKGSSHTIEEWLTTKDPSKRAGFQASAARYIPEALYFLEKLLPYIMKMRQVLPFLEEEDRIWDVLNRDISTLDIKQLEQELIEKAKITKTEDSLSQSAIKKQQAEIRSIKDLIRIKNAPTETRKQLVKEIHQLQLETTQILKQAYQDLLELWNGCLRDNCPLPLNRSETAISDIKNSNIEQLINEIESLLHSEVRLKKPIFGREIDKDSFFNDTHKRTNTLSQPITKDEESEIKDPVELFLKLQQKQVCLLDGFNKVLSSIVYNAVGTEGIRQCERYESDYEKGAHKWHGSKKLPVPIQANDNNIAIIAKWIYKNIMNMHNALTSQETLQRKTSIFGFLAKKPSRSEPSTPRVNKLTSYSQKELEEIYKLEQQIAPVAKKLMDSQLPLNQEERQNYLDLHAKFDILVKLRPEYKTLQNDIRKLLAPPETKAKVMSTDDATQDINLVI